MKLKSITSYNQFKDNLSQVGFTLAGDNEGLFSLSDVFEDNIKYHTEDADTDPWVWRMACLKEKEGYVYSKLFFKKGGYITKEWYPYFFRIRRGDKIMEEEYLAGNVSQMAKRIYDVVSETPNVSLTDIKLALEATKADKSKIDTAITKLQMGMYITISGQTYKTGKDGKPYGWPVNTFTTCERFVGENVIEASSKLDPDEAYNTISNRIKEMNPEAPDRTIKKFILG